MARLDPARLPPFPPIFGPDALNRLREVCGLDARTVLEAAQVDAVPDCLVTITMRVRATSAMIRALAGDETEETHDGQG